MSITTIALNPGPPGSAGNLRSHYIQKALPQQAATASPVLLPRVCLFTDSDVYAGTESHILELALAMRRLDVPVRIAAPLPSELGHRATPLGVSVIPIAKRGLVDFAAIRTLRNLLAEGQLDVIHAHNGRTALAAAVAVWSAGRGVALATQHFLEPNHTRHTGLKRQFTRLAHEWVAHHIDVHIAISHAVLDSMLQRNEAPASRVAVVPNGISPIDASTLIAPASMRERLDISPERFLIVCAARLEPEKNVACLLQAMRQVADHFPQALCVILGDGSQATQLNELIGALNLEGHVRLLGFRSDATSIINAGDVFVLPSLAEPFGLVLIEAMALHKPVIATDAGGPREIVENQISGLVVPPKDSDKLAAAIGLLLKNPELRQEIATGGYQRFRNCYTSDRMARSILSIYQRAMRAAPHSPRADERAPH